MSVEYISYIHSYLTEWPEWGNMIKIAPKDKSIVLFHHLQHMARTVLKCLHNASSSFTWFYWSPRTSNIFLSFNGITSRRESHAPLYTISLFSHAIWTIEYRSSNSSLFILFHVGPIYITLCVICHSFNSLTLFDVKIVVLRFKTMSVVLREW